MLRDAFRAVHTNVGALFLFLMIDLPLTMAVASLNEFYVAPRSEELSDQVIGLIQTGAVVIQVFVYAAVASIVFSKMAKNIDYPMWKIHGSGDALSRFFPMWLLLFFVSVAVIQFGIIAFQQGDENLGAGLQFGGIVLLITVIPFGAIVTFLGNGRGEDLRVAFTIIPRVIDRFLVAMLIGFVQISIVQTVLLEEGTAFWMKPMVSAFDVYLDCVVFSYIFLACREQRDMEEPVDPYDL